MQMEASDPKQIIAEHRKAGEFIQVEGLRIFHRKAGPTTGIPVVMTHGIPRSSFLYRKMIPILAQHHPVRAWDLYGFGLSEKPKDTKGYHYREFRDFFGKYLDALGIDRVHLVCHDVGGPFTIGWAAHNQERVASLTILDTTIFLKGYRIPAPVFALIVAPMSLQSMAVPDERFGDFILRYIQKRALYRPESLNGPEGNVFKELLLRDGGRVTLTKTLKGYLRPHESIKARLSDFKSPTLIVWGRQDPFCTLPTAHRFKKVIPHARLHVIENASHFLQEDAPEEVSRLILDFLKTCG